jgi:1-phosphatidylinositol-4-phosphate 5-kinase
LITAKGDIYEGSFLEGYQDGEGKMIFADKSLYEGNWQHGERHGFGIFSALRFKYEGEWSKGLRHGSGKFYDFSNRTTYNGSWMNDEVKGL